MLSFALVNWGSSSAWFGTYFLGCIEKSMIHHKSLCSVKSLDCFQCFEECQHKCSFEFPFVQEWGVSAPSSNTLFSCWNCYAKSVERFLVNVNSATVRMLRWRFCRTISRSFLILASVFYVLGQQGCWLSLTPSLPFLNLLKHSNTWVRDRHSSP